MLHPRLNKHSALYTLSSFHKVTVIISVISWSLSARHCASPACAWRRQPPNTESSCKYIEQESQTADKGGPPVWSLEEGLTTPHRNKNLNMLRNWIQSLQTGRILYISIS